MEIIDYYTNRKITAQEFISVLQKSTLSERRPVHDLSRIQSMLDHANIIVTAWAGHQLVGVSRAMCDVGFCCYLSDLAVDQQFQKQGIGKKLIEETHRAAGDHAQLILLAAPAAVQYYPHIGMQRFEHCFVLPRKLN